jgi:signal transduction histidine kinase
VDQNSREPNDLLANERAARIEAERASHLKDEFLATLGHELRNPLNAILGWARLMELGRLSPEEALGGAQTIVRNVRVLSQIVNDVLDVSSMVSGKTRIDPEETDVCEVIEATLENLKSTAEAQQIMWNLLSNAVKFTPRRGRVAVNLECSGASCRIAVSDTGDGIPQEILPFIFERFRQAPTPQGTSNRGLGLGLAIVKQLVELHGGSVAVESAGVGHGTTFTVMLPRLASLDELAGAPPPESNGAMARG